MGSCPHHSQQMWAVEQEYVRSMRHSRLVHGTRDTGRLPRDRRRTESILTEAAVLGHNAHSLVGPTPFRAGLPAASSLVSPPLR